MILITGASGFLGHHLKEYFTEQKEKILTPDRHELDLIQFSEFSIESYLKRNHVNSIIHLAATVGGISANKKNPGKYFYDNMRMGLHLINAAKNVKVSKFVFLSTVCSYPKFTPVPFREEDLWNGFPEETNAPYGIAKKALMLMGQAYRDQYGMNFITLISVNLFGSHDNFDLESSHVIPALVRKIQDAKDKRLPEVEVWGTGTVSREFLHAKDCAKAVYLAYKYYNESAPINIGSGQEILIKDLAELIAEIIDYNGKIVRNSSKPDGQPRRCLDVTKAKQKFGFEAQVSLRKGLEETIKYWSSIKSTVH